MYVNRIALKKAAAIDIAESESENAFEVLNLDSRVPTVFIAKNRQEKELWLDVLECAPHFIIVNPKSLKYFVLVQILSLRNGSDESLNFEALRLAYLYRSRYSFFSFIIFPFSLF